jgi:sortase A
MAVMELSPPRRHVPGPSFIHIPRLLSWLMFGGAVGIFLYVGSNVAYTANTQAQLTQSWEQTHPPIATSASQPAPALTFDRPRLAYGQPLAKIVVPSIGWNGIVLEGTDSRILSGGPGHLTGTAYPGENDNMVISNHNSYSLAWGKAHAGDIIQLQTNYGTYSYKVVDFRVIDATDTSVTASTHRPTLRFITCWPLYAGAFASQRYVVFADLVQ